MADIPLFVDNVSGGAVGFVPYKKKSNNVVLDEALRRTFVAIADTFIPEMTDEETDVVVQMHAVSDEHAQAIRGYCKRKASDTDCIEKCLAVLDDPYRIPKAQVDDLLFALRLMSSSIGMFALSGHTSPFADLSPLERDAVMNHLLTSSIFKKRMLAHSLRCLICITYYASVPPPTAPGVDPSRTNPSWAALRYPGPDPSVVARSRTRAKLASRGGCGMVAVVAAADAPASAAACTSGGNAKDTNDAEDDFRFPTALPMHLFHLSSPTDPVSAGRARLRADAPHSYLPHWYLAFHPHLSLAPLRPFLFPAPVRGPTLPLPALHHTPSPSASASASSASTTSAVPPLTLYADIVIIGSGCGGGVAADVLAQPGRRVLILEAGGLQHPRALSLVEEDAFRDQYEAGGFLQTADGSMAVLAGRTAGGGSAVNWACCLDPPQAVRREWAAQGLPLFETPLFSSCVEYARTVMDVHDHPDGHHNGANAALLCGARRAGLDARVLPQNGKGAHACGWCSFGCANGAKMGSLHGTIPAAQSRGAALIPNCTVHTITHTKTHAPAPTTTTTTTSASTSTSTSTSTSADAPYTLSVGDVRLPLALDSPTSPDHLSAPYLAHRAPRTVTGVTATVRVPVPDATPLPHAPRYTRATAVREIPLRIVAPVVVCAGGALHSPVLLRRSGLRNPHIGRHLRLHPVCGVVGVYDKGHTLDTDAPCGREHQAHLRTRDGQDSQASQASQASDPSSSSSSSSSSAAIAAAEICCFEGTQMTSICTAAADVHGDGYGCRVETPAVHPGLAGFAMRWGATRGYFEEEEEEDDEKKEESVSTSASTSASASASVSASPARLARRSTGGRSGSRFKEQMCGLRKVVPLICIARDSGEGTVTYKDSRLHIDYSVSSKDQYSLVQGIRTAVQLHVAAGCTEVAAPQVALPPLRCGPLGLADPRVQRYLAAIEREGVSACGMGLFSAHQMGSCRLAPCPSRGALRPSGETWDCDGLFVCDAAAMPTASGVNPMMTVAALARLVSAFVSVRADMLARERTSTAAHMRTRTDANMSRATATTPVSADVEAGETAEVAGAVAWTDAFVHERQWTQGTRSSGVVDGGAVPAEYAKL